VRFLISPLELVAAPDGHVSALRLVRNRLLRTTTGSITSEPTDDVEELKTGLVFRALDTEVLRCRVFQ
jgi:hypothetical protein